MVTFVAVSSPTDDELDSSGYFSWICARYWACGNQMHLLFLFWWKKFVSNHTWSKSNLPSMRDFVCQPPSTSDLVFSIDYNRHLSFTQTLNLCTCKANYTKSKIQLLFSHILPTSFLFPHKKPLLGYKKPLSMIKSPFKKLFITALHGRERQATDSKKLSQLLRASRVQ